MNHLPVIEALAIVIVLTAVVFYLCTLLRQSTIIGFMLVGVLLGPSVLNIFPEEAFVHGLAEIGVLIFLFVIGLNTHIKSVRDIISTTLGIAILQIMICIAATIAVLVAFGFDWKAAMVVGVLVSFSSTALVLGAYEENNMLTSISGRIAIGVLVFQDIFAVLAVAALPLISTTGEGIREMAFRLVELVIFIPLFFIITRRFFPKLIRRAALIRRREFLLLATLALCLFASTITERLGGGYILGAFIAGLVLSDTIVVHQLHSQLHTLRHLLLGFFFIAIGLLLDLRILWMNVEWIFLGLLAVLLLKTLVFYGIIKIYGYRSNIALSTGIALCQVGEFSFVVAEAAFPLDLIPPVVYQSMLAIALVSMLLTPLIISAVMRKILSVCIPPETKARPLAVLQYMRRTKSPMLLWLVMVQ